MPEKLKPNEHLFYSASLDVKWSGKTPAQAADIVHDKWHRLCKDSETAIVHSVQFFHSTISWSLANAYEEGSTINYGVTVRAQDNSWIAADNFFIVKMGLDSYYNGAAETYNANRRDFRAMRQNQKPDWRFQKGIDVGEKIRTYIGWGGYNGDVVALSKDVTVFVLIEYEVKKREIPKFLKVRQ